MSNEEIVARIQSGEQEHMEELWGQVAGLVKRKARHIMTALESCGGRGVELDDLCQSGYLAMVEAVKTYDPTAGTMFSTWFMYYLQKIFGEVTDYQTKRRQLDPINNALSLDMPMTDDPKSGQLSNIIPDPNNLIESTEDKIWHEQLHEAMEHVLGEIPEEQSLVLRHRFYAGQTLAATGYILGMPAEEVRKLEGRGIKALRHHRLAKTIRPFYDFDYYNGAGLGAFRSSGMSIQERYLVFVEEQNKREQKAKT